MNPITTLTVTPDAPTQLQQVRAGFATGMALGGLTWKSTALGDSGTLCSIPMDGRLAVLLGGIGGAAAVLGIQMLLETLVAGIEGP